MAKVSNFRAYITRSYVTNGHSRTKKYECSQLPQHYGYTNVPDEYYYAGQAANFSMSPRTMIQLYNRLGDFEYCNYGPGLVFVSDDIMKLSDLIPPSFFTVYDNQPVSNLLDVATIMITKAWEHMLANPGVTDTVLYNYTNPNEKFIYDDETGEWGIWNFWMMAHVNYGRVNGRINVQIFGLSLDVFTDFCSPGMLEFKLDVGGTNVGHWFANTPDGYGRVDTIANGKYCVSEQEPILGVNLEHALQTSSFSELNRATVNLCKMLEEQKYSFCTNSLYVLRYDRETRNGCTTYGVNFNNNGGRPTYGMYFLIDTSECSLTPYEGFYTLKISKYFNGIVETISGDGPGNNNPTNRDDDPNDKDKKPNPGDKGGNGKHDDTTDTISKPFFPTISGAGAGLFKIFSPTTSQLAALGQVLWTQDVLENLKQYFTNPLDCVLGLGIIPVTPVYSGQSEICLGLYRTGVNANVVSSDYVEIDCGTIPLERYYGSYLDYSPYTKISIYLPYIGEVDINPDEAMQKNINVWYYVNVVTGDLVAMIFLDGDLFYTATGNCLRQLPLSSSDYSAIINTAVAATAGIVSAVATGGVGAASVAATQAGAHVTDEAVELASRRAAASNVGSATSLLGDVMNAKMKYGHAGTLGTGAGQLARQKPYLIIERPNLDLASNYKSFVGYPCNKTKQIGMCSGFTQIEASNISISGATDSELALAKTLLMEGVII